MDVTQDSEGLVKILETRDQGMAAMAKSLLDGAGIEYATNNEFSQNVWPTGLADGAQIWVRPEDADAALEILSGLEATDEESEAEATVDQQADIELSSPTDLASIPPPQPEQPFILRLLWLIGMLLIPLVLVIIYSLNHD